MYVDRTKEVAVASFHNSILTQHRLVFAVSWAIIAILSGGCRPGAKSSTDPLEGGPAEAGPGAEPVVIEARQTIKPGFVRQRGTGDPSEPVAITTVSISSDGRRVLVGGPYVQGKDCQVWDLTTNPAVRLTELDGGPATLSADGQSVVGFVRGNFNIRSHLFAGSVNGPPQKLAEPAFGIPGPPWLATTPEAALSVLSDKYKGIDAAQSTRVVAWDLMTGIEKYGIEVGRNEEPPLCSTPFFGASRVATGHGKGGLQVKVWELPSGRLLKTIATSGGPNAFWLGLSGSPDGRLVAGYVFGVGLTVWEIDSGKIVCKVDSGIASPNARVAFSPDGKLLFHDRINNLEKSAGGEANAIALNSGKVRAAFRGHGARVSAIAVSGDGKSLVTGSEDGTAKVWDLSSLK
jgi:WD40 repeat protein